MAVTRGPVHLGDLLTAARVLRLESPDGLRLLARTLGLPLPEPPAAGAPQQPRAVEVPVQARQPARPDPAVRDREPGPAPGRPRGPRPSPAPRLPSARTVGPGDADTVAEPSTGSLTMLRGPDPGMRPRPPADPPTLPLLEQRHPAVRRPPPPWDPRTQRGVMLAAASTDVPGREVDRDRLVDLAVRSLAGQAPRRGVRVPRRVRPTTREGAVLLLDRATSMQPFRHDQAWLAELAGRVLRRDRVQVLDLLLRRGVSGDGGRSWQPYRPPSPGRPVLLLSDLGVLAVPFADRTATTPVEWLPWLRRLRRSGSPVTCLTPFPPESYPAVVRQAVPLVPLDRRTSIRFAHAETRRFHDRGPRG
ncbi:hypothetical protein [Peterkaempfera bronchialis]|uniref:hypothetical protein n=1 Tax=Peterkaempfera bronchialis TaxID=2126346 RepID=UPI003C2CCAC4